MLIVVVGTGTGVGKTHVACALAQWFRRDGAVALKPVESGAQGGEPADALALARAAGHRTILPRYLFAPALSPHLAAREAGIDITAEEIAAWVRRHQTTTSTVLETAGGLFSPLASGLTNADLVALLAPDEVVLVAPDRLGVLHDVTAALRAFDRRAVVVLSAPAEPDASTSRNAAELTTLGIVSHEPIVFPRRRLDAPETKRAVAELAARLTAGSAS